MLREFNALHRHVKGGCVFVPRVLPPPLDRLDCFGLSLCSRRRAEKLEAELTVDIQHAICADELGGRGGGKTVNFSILKKKR